MNFFKTSASFMALLHISLPLKAAELKKRRFDQEMTYITDALLSTREDLELEVLSNEDSQNESNLSSVDLLEI